MFNRILRSVKWRLGIREKDPQQNISINPTAVVIDVKFGEFVKISHQSYMQNLEIGDYTYFAGYNTVINATIGKFCSIGEGVIIGPGMHPVKTFVSTSPVFFSTYAQCGTTFSDGFYFKEMGKVAIGNDVWIGVNAVVLDDVAIGHGAIVAAGAVVNKNVEPYAIVGGIPAKVLGYRFEKEEIETLLKDQWWNKDINWLKTNFKSFHNIKDYLEKLKNQA
jgi:acetyltransferase-like isoleucine patch superfamily enzyme